MRTILLTITGIMSVAQIACSQSPAACVFKAAGSNEFTFDTGILRGKLRGGGRANGLSSVFHVPSGTRLDASLGLFSHYRVFSAGKRYGTAAWDWSAESELRPDGSVQTRWAETAERPFELRATYRWAAPNSLDVETTVVARTNLPAFESFLASYFSSGFTNALVCVGSSTGAAPGQEFMPVLASGGTWQAFPRDDQAAGIIRDGRWKLEPNPVDWVLMPRFAKPLAVRRAPAAQLTAVVMGTPADCFAICTPHQLESHYSTYLSLFGRDLKPGSSHTARTRLVIDANLSEQEILAAYRAFLK